MAHIDLKKLGKTFDNDVEVIKDLDLKIVNGEFLVLVGPSGCGKSTTLRLIAGLEEATAGEIYIGDKMVNNTPPKDRDISMVFQNYALYPHMTVYDNMAFGLKLRKYHKSEIKKLVEDTAEILELEKLLKRKPKQLSGGQRQRVALGRAIVRKPSVFLFDEPLSNLDAKLRVQMRTEIKKLHKTLKTTMVYVTHDQTEAMTMGDRIAVMKDGVIHQLDTPINVYNDPADKFVAGFIGSPAMNFLEGVIVDGHIVIEEGKYNLPIIEKHKELLKSSHNQKIIVGIRPEDISLSKESESSFEVNLQCDIVEPTGHEALIYLNTGKTEIICKTDKYDHSVMKKDDLTVYFDVNKVLYFDAENGKRIK
ncbi:MAG: sn-glycerol-3-phosphate ABC transporter ATP-binding protein UgpC [Candidatus Marinimicrobia bacterium]|nr:sn-glycerol-3-phosphate ABC transporter ATP-binding protein UgpC [Candidatus Neomarinimicrobiota bacterium]